MAVLSATCPSLASCDLLFSFRPRRRRPRSIWALPPFRGECGGECGESAPECSEARRTSSSQISMRAERGSVDVEPEVKDRGAAGAGAAAQSLRGGEEEAWPERRVMTGGEERLWFLRGGGAAIDWEVPFEEGCRKERR